MPPNIFQLTRQPDRSDAIYGVINYVQHEIIECPRHGRWQGKQISDLEIELYGVELQAFVRVDGPELVATESLLALLKENDIKGYRSRNVNIVNHERYPSVPTLYQLVVTGTAGYAPPIMGLSIVGECEICGRVEYPEIPSDLTIIVDALQWDGSDVFTLFELPGYPIVTDNVARILKNAHVTNFGLQPVSWTQ